MIFSSQNKLTGFINSILEYSKVTEQWEIRSGFNNTLMAFTNETTDFPEGMHPWYFDSNCKDEGFINNQKCAMSYLHLSYSHNVSESEEPNHDHKSLGRTGKTSPFLTLHYFSSPLRCKITKWSLNRPFPKL